MSVQTQVTRFLSAAVLFVGMTSLAEAQTATFSRYNDAVAGRCYEPAGTAPDPANPNLLRIAMATCSASAPNGSAISGDSFSFLVTAPPGYFVSRLTFAQTGTSGGSRGGTGFRSFSWTADTKALPSTGTLDLSLQRLTEVPVSLSTFLAAFGIQVVSGFATASNPTVLVELAPLQ